MNIKRCTYFLVSSPDRPGEASNLVSTLNQNTVDLEGLWGYGTSKNKAEFFVVPKNPGQFRNTANKVGITYSEGTCFRVTSADEPGALMSTLSTIARHDINLSAVNATAVAGQIGAYLWCEESDVERLGKALNA